MKREELIVEICMGSSCYSRGNRDSIELIENFVSQENPPIKLSVTGKLCMEACAKGPTVIINNKVHNEVHPNCIIDLLRFHMQEQL